MDSPPSFVWLQSTVPYEVNYLAPMRLFGRSPQLLPRFRDQQLEELCNHSFLK